MNRRKWGGKTKATVVLEGLKGKPVAAYLNVIRVNFHLTDLAALLEQGEVE